MTQRIEYRVLVNGVPCGRPAYQSYDQALKHAEVFHLPNEGQVEIQSRTVTVTDWRTEDA